ncbi:MAG: hypothetical protein EXR65_04725 [Dehalococcoidia bacterium]|nr:hypothetical protein [Dehalococcoidia bacterium]
MWHYGWGGGDWLWMLFMMAVVWIPLAALVAWFVRGAMGQLRHDHPSSPDAVETARQAYARDEMTRETFLQTIEDLRAHR